MSENLSFNNVIQPRLAEFDKNENSTSGGGLSRRSFIKRAGGATAATFLAWQGLSIQARAVMVNKSSNSSGSKSNWKIKVVGDSHIEYTNGQSFEFTYNEGGIEKTAWYKISRRRITSWPSTLYKSSATCDLTLKAEHWGQVKWVANGSFAPMSATEWEWFKTQFPNVFSDAELVMSGSLTKYINPDSGVVITDPPTVMGLALGHEDFDETKGDNGLNLSIHWQDVVREGDAKVDVRDWGGYGNSLGANDDTYDVTFYKKAVHIIK